MVAALYPALGHIGKPGDVGGELPEVLGQRLPADEVAYTLPPSRLVAAVNDSSIPSSVASRTAR